MGPVTAFAAFTFEAAHRLPFVPDGHKCGRLHGHNWTVEIHCTGDMEPTLGWVVDFYVIECAWRELIYNVVDHRLLNEIEGLENPTTEVIARWIWQRVALAIPSLSKVVVRETPMFGAIYCGEKGTPDAV